jgi:hypothetical protein
MRKSAGCERVISGNVREMPRVVQGKDADVVAAANFETIDPAV